MIARIRAYLLRHAQNFVGALGMLVRQPAASALTITVIAIALAMPAALNVIVQNGRALAGGWESVRDFSVYLKPGSKLEDARRLETQLAKSPSIASVELISADDALRDFREDPEFGELLGALETNPLPHALVIRPEDSTEPATLDTLKTELTKNSLVDLVKLDAEWVQRLNAFLDLARRAVWIAAILLIVAVVVIVGNTIRLDIQNRRAEIEVSKLLGASDGFVRRPFLYTGFWYGLAGAVGAVVLLAIALWLLSGPVLRLVTLYGGAFEPFGMDGTTILTIFAAGLGAGLGGAWIAVARHLAAIQPRV